MAACCCSGCPHATNCRCRCSECHDLAASAQRGFYQFTPFVDLDELAWKIAEKIEERRKRTTKPTNKKAEP